MRYRQPLFALVVILLAFTTPSLAVQQDHTATSSRNMVASVHPLATAAGIEAFRNGGNAIDAAVSTALMLGVVDGFNSGIGGGCFILIRTSDGKISAIDGREMAPAAAHRDMFLRDGKAVSELSQTGPLASGVPGALAAYGDAVSEFGRLPLSQSLIRAADRAESGFEVTPDYHTRLKSASMDLARFPASAGVLLNSGGEVFDVGETIIQKDLANTYRQIAHLGQDWFYRGPFAETTGRWMKDNGGIMTADDFANYHTVRRDPVRSTYRGHDIIGFPPPSSGGVHVAQILNILECFDLKELHRTDPIRMKHVVAEAMKLAFADRAYWLGDPDFVNVPRGLIDTAYARKLADRVRLDAAIEVESHGIPPRSDSDFFEKHTTHIAAADAEGNWVAITTTINTTFGSKVIVPGLGVPMNNQMDDFSIAPGVPNAFGLIGGENNAVAPGKRPLSSMSPTIVLKDGRPVLTVGAAGGPKIITQVVWAIINHLDLEMPIGESIAAPRIHHQWSPDRLLAERTMEDSVVKGLQQLGHEITRSSTVGICQAISFDPESGLFTGAHDPRTSGQAGGLK